MNAYKITLRGYNADGSFSIVNAKTPGKAKYQHFLSLDGLFDNFAHYLRFVQSCIKIGLANRARVYGDQQEFRKVATYRHVPAAYPGMMVELHGKKGYIVGVNDSCNFNVLFENGIFNCHPHYEMVYYDKDGSIAYDFRTGK